MCIWKHPLFECVAVVCRSEVRDIPCQDPLESSKNFKVLSSLKYFYPTLLCHFVDLIKCI